MHFMYYIVAAMLSRVLLTTDVGLIVGDSTHRPFAGVISVSVYLRQAGVPKVSSARPRCLLFDGCSSVSPDRFSDRILALSDLAAMHDVSKRRPFMKTVSVSSSVRWSVTNGGWCIDERQFNGSSCVVDRMYDSVFLCSPCSFVSTGSRDAFDGDTKQRHQRQFVVR
jgi:hypothetical protein